MSRKFLLSLASLLAVAALGVVASSAGAVVCTANVLCSSVAGEKLRDDFTEPPEAVSGGSFGTSALAVNTVAAIRLTIGANFNENPKGDAFFGIKIHSDPPTVAAGTTCKEGLGEAEGWVTFVDIQNATTGTTKVASPVFDDTSPGDNGPWPIGIRSDNCSTATHPGRVVIEHVALFFPTLANTTVTGTLLGTWAPPAVGRCENASGGVELTEAQTVSINGKSGEAVTINNGTAGKPAFICFVSANNYLFPNTPPVWTPLTGGINKD